MKLEHAWSRWSAALAIAVLAVLAGPAAAQSEDRVTLTGEVEVVEYDDDGNVTAVAVFDAEWGSVLVAQTGKGSELLDHVGEVVKVTGTIEELEDEAGYYYVIRVSGYSVEEPAMPGDDPGRDR